ncbi:helix-turn-helix domain-containing protein [Candidatus Gracilibacteria bacterium]|nr:helix-turn-helix domain-containing protein [Candidatus Gracilibacteria bacterium]
MYTLTRQEAADILYMSTRSVDRYIRSGKLRSEKRGKIVYVHEADVNNIAGKTEKKPHLIIPKEAIQEPSVTVSTPSVSSPGVLDKVYDDLRGEIKKKDELITELSLRVGRAEEIAKNSISLADFKKSQFLLEESKGHLGKEVEHLAEKNSNLQKELKYEKNTNIILIVFVLFLLIAAASIWFIRV